MTNDRLAARQQIEKAKYSTKQYVDGSSPISTTLNSELANFLYRIKDQFTELGEIADVTRGVHPYRTGGYGKSYYSNGSQIQCDVDERPYHSKKIKKGYRPFICGKDLKRFALPEEKEYVLYGDWLAEPRNPRYFEGERIHSRKILGKHLIVTLENRNSVADQQVCVTKPKVADYHATYFAGLLGSRFIAFFVRQYFGEVNDAFPQIKVGQLQSLPIRTIDFNNPDEKKMHDNLVLLVEKMLEFNKQLQKVHFDSEKEPIERQIAATDKKIDELVYELYGLTQEEIRIVEGK